MLVSYFDETVSGAKYWCKPGSCISSLEQFPLCELMGVLTFGRQYSPCRVFSSCTYRTWISGLTFDATLQTRCSGVWNGIFFDCKRFAVWSVWVGVYIPMRITTNWWFRMSSFLLSDFQLSEAEYNSIPCSVQVSCPFCFKFLWVMICFQLGTPYFKNSTVINPVCTQRTGGMFNQHVSLSIWNARKIFHNFKF